MPTSTSPNALLLTADETVQLVGGGVSTRSIWRWSAQGRFPKPVKLGGRSLWRRKEIEQFILEADGDIRKLNQLKRGKP